MVAGLETSGDRVRSLAADWCCRWLLPARALVLQRKAPLRLGKDAAPPRRPWLKRCKQECGYDQKTSPKVHQEAVRKQTWKHRLV